MRLYLAPMEEITGYVFRNTLEKHFGGVDKYYTPFVSPNQNKILKTRAGREMDPVHNAGKETVIQTLTNSGEHFNEFAKLVAELGYREINFNCGCPSNTVVKKRKGSGILRDTDLLDEVLERIFHGDDSIQKAIPDMKISVKTRLGVNEDDEFEDILKVYAKYPISELTIHGRVQKDFYKGKSRLEGIIYAIKNVDIPVVYNGDIFSVGDYSNLFEEIAKAGINNISQDDIPVMIGRGAVRNPGIFREIKTGQKTTREELRLFVDDLYKTYQTDYSEVDAICKLKEVWVYMSDMFRDIDSPLKDLRKSKIAAEYKAAVNEIFSCPFDIS